MRYALVDHDGELTFPEGGWDEIAALFRPGTWAPCPMAALEPFVGFRGLVAAEATTSPRNVPGTLLLQAFGAVLRPYAGPVVILKYTAPPLGSPCLAGLDDGLVAVLRGAHDFLGRAVEGSGPPMGVPRAEWEPWSAAIREIASAVPLMTAPEIKVRAAALRGRP